MTKEIEIDEVTASLIAGLGKYLKEYRESSGLKQKELAAKLDLGETRMKHYESGSVEAVGASGFPISLLSKLADLTGTSVIDVFKEIARKSPMSFKELSLSEKIELLLTSETRKFFEKSIKKGDEASTDELSWAMKMAVRLLQLKEKTRVELEIEILKSSAGGSFSKDDKDRFNELLKRRLELDMESIGKK